KKHKLIESYPSTSKLKRIMLVDLSVTVSMIGDFFYLLFFADYQPAPFSEKFFLVVIEKDLNGNSVLQMWHLHLQSVQACVGHLSSSSIYPVCLAPYLIVTTCSDSHVRFWRCAMEGDDGGDMESQVYRWEPWILMNEEKDNNSAVCVSGRPVAVSCSYIGRLAVAFKQPRQGLVGY
ncbi:hypothetical protein XENOCAPTIV_027999, partial [Xenoophorus captivus]